MNNLPIVTPQSKPTDFNQDEYIMIRGFPRPRANVKYVEEMLSGKLVQDSEAALMTELDHHLFAARQKLGHFPDFIQLPGEPFAYFCPVPFDINFMGTVLKSWKKPAWFKCLRVMNVPWSNK